MNHRVRYFPQGFTGDDSESIELPDDDSEVSKSLLDRLLGEGIKIPQSCRAGLCQACLMQAEQPMGLNSEATLGLSESQQRQGLFMACQCFPEQSIDVALPSHDSDWQAELVTRREFAGEVLELTFRVDGQWNPGEHVLLWKDAEHGRPYSIASVCDTDKLLTLHVLRHGDGLVSQWCHDELVVGQQVRLSPPQGHCVFDAHQSGDLLLLAEQSGFGPLWGVAQQALKESPDIEIDILYVGSLELSADDHVAEPYPQALFREGESCRLHLMSEALQPCDDEMEQRSVWSGFLRKNTRDLSRRRVYIAGSAGFVDLVSKVCFFAGVARRQMLTEVFARGNGDDH